jgi:hypothetical protein
MIKAKSLLAASCLALAISTNVQAEDTAALAISAGVFDLAKDESAAEVGIEYRFAPMASFYDIIPAVGVAANFDGGYWAHAGIRYDIDLGTNWALTPNFAVVGYEKGGGKDLGHGLEFRSGIELAYKLNESSHLGLALYHLSHAGIGGDNPGQESLILSYSFSPNF